MLQFLVSVYITPAALMAWTNDVSFVAERNVKDGKQSYEELLCFFFPCVNRA